MGGLVRGKRVGRGGQIEVHLARRVRTHIGGDVLGIFGERHAQIDVGNPLREQRGVVVHRGRRREVELVAVRALLVGVPASEREACTRRVFRGLQRVGRLDRLLRRVGALGHRDALDPVLGVDRGVLG